MVKLAFVLMLINAIFFALSFFAKSKVQLLLLQIVSYIFFSLQYLVVGAYTGAIVVAVDAMRIIAFYFIEKYKNTNTVRLAAGAIFIVICIVSTALTWDKWYSILPALGTIAVIISIMINKLLVIKIVSLITCPFQLVYMILIKSYLNIIIEVCIIIAISIAVIIDLVKLKKQKAASAIR